MSAADAADPMAALLQRDYWMIRSTPAPTTTQADVENCAPVHVRWLLGLEESGCLLLSGPLLTGPGVTAGSGVTVVRADTEQEAIDIANADPFVLKGLRSFEVFKWRVNEGSIGVRLSLGTGTYQWR